MDYHATTPVDRRVLAQMLPYFDRDFGNAGNRTYSLGVRARDAIDQARQQIADLLGGRESEIIFTSGATESDNLALKGVAHYLREKGKNQIIVQRTEHKAVLDSATRLKREGFEIIVLEVDSKGRVDPKDVKQAICERTALVSIMACNNEVGTVQDLHAIGAITRHHGILLHTDAAQGLGYLSLNVQEVPVDLVSISGHKIYAPKGVGALWVRRDQPRVRLVAEIDGGGHERGMRSGTLNTPGIVALGKACEIQREEGAVEAKRIRKLRDHLWALLHDQIPEIQLNGALLDESRHPGNLNISFGYVDGQKLVLELCKIVAVSSGSACMSASIEPSYVLRAMGVEPDLASASIRFGLGRYTTSDEVEQVAQACVNIVSALRSESPLWTSRHDPIDW